MPADSAAGSPLEIRLFGPFDVRIHGRPLAPLRSRRGRYLLALLTLRHGRDVERGWLAGTLWPDNPESQALYNLRRNLSDLRRALGDQACRLCSPTPRTLRLDLAGAFADVPAFDESSALTDSPSLELAERLYRGPLLEGCDEEWIFQERQQRELVFLRVLDSLGAAALERGDPASAVRRLRMSVAVDPLRESAQRALMRALAQSEDYAEAVQVYHRLRRLLRDSLNAEPAGETQALYQRIRAWARDSAKCSSPESAARSVELPRCDDPTAAPGNLQAQRSSLRTGFFGREKELADLRHMLRPEAANGRPLTREREDGASAARLVTLTGAGGVGKTRLALEVARRIAPSLGDSVWFVSLAETSEPGTVPGAIMRAMGIENAGKEDPLDLMTAVLSGRPSLLILDSFEHLADSAGFVGDLVDRAPRLSCLITSRQRLGLTGEHEYAVAPLPTPASPGTPERVLEFASVQLFTDRVAAIRPDFRISRENAEAVAALCHRLDGIPLAIELAAARAQVLSPSQMLGQLDRRFDFLVSRERNTIARHRTLRAAIEWSYHLLSPDLRSLFAGLSVFRGGWTLEAASAVCGEQGGDAFGCSALAGIEELRDRSLVVASEVGSEMRFSMLETLREFAAEQLSPSDAAALSQRHAAHYLRVAEEAEPHLNGPEKRHWFVTLQRDVDNFRASLVWGLEPDYPERHCIALRMAAALWSFWQTQGYCAEGRRWVEAALRLSETDPCEPERAKALKVLGCLAYEQGDYGTAHSSWCAALSIRRRLCDKPNAAILLHNLAAIAKHEDDLDGAACLLDEALAIRRDLDDKAGMASDLNSLGLVARRRGDSACALKYLTDGLELARQAGDRAREASTLANLGNLWCGVGDYQRAQQCDIESLALHRALNDEHGTATALQNLGRVLLALNEMEHARACYTEAIAILRDLGGTGEIPGVLEGLARACAAGGRASAGARLLGAASALREAAGRSVPPPDREWLQQVRAEMAAALGPYAFESAIAEGRLLSLEQAIDRALGDSAIASQA